jgi:ketosteroid isomerase-like protein
MMTATSDVSKDAAMNIQDDRAADREAICAHIDSIFQAFIKKDAAALRATHAQNWLGHLEGSRTMIHGIDGYMDNVYVDPKSPYGMKSYKMREFDMIFKGDAAFVCFVADVEANTPNGPFHRALRISDFYTKQNGQWKIESERVAGKQVACGAGGSIKPGVERSGTPGSGTQTIPSPRSRRQKLHERRAPPFTVRPQLD